MTSMLPNYGGQAVAVGGLDQLTTQGKPPKKLGWLDLLDEQIERLSTLLDELEVTTRPIRVEPGPAPSGTVAPQPGTEPRTRLQSLTAQLEYRLERLKRLTFEIEL